MKGIILIFQLSIPYLSIPWNKNLVLFFSPILLYTDLSLRVGRRNFDTLANSKCHPFLPLKQTNQHHVSHIQQYLRRILNQIHIVRLLFFGVFLIYVNYILIKVFLTLPLFVHGNAGKLTRVSQIKYETSKKVLSDWYKTPPWWGASSVLRTGVAISRSLLSLDAAAIQKLCSVILTKYWAKYLD